MSNPVPVCTHVKTNGEGCGSPAMSGSECCYHHSTVKAALGKVQPNGKAANGGFAPIPFVFPEDRASMQINFFLLLQAYNERRIDQRTYNSLLSLLKSMARNLGKSGKLTEDKEPAAQEKRRESLAERKAREQEEDPNYIPPGYAYELERLDREMEEEARAKEQEKGERSISKADGLESVVDLKARAIAPESCFSTTPRVR